MKYLSKIFFASGLILSGCSKPVAETQKEPQSQKQPTACPHCVTPVELNKTVPEKKYLTLGTDFNLEGLIDHNGNEIHDADFRGKRLIIQFGFKDCVLICKPATQALGSALTDYKEGEVTLILIASKPGYTPEDQNAFLRQFGGDKIGALALTGSEKALAKLYKQLDIIALDGTHSPFSHYINEKGEMVDVKPPLKKSQGQILPSREAVIDAIGRNFMIFPLVKSAPQTPQPQ